MVSGIHHTSFTVSNIDKSIAFYRDVLGMDVTWDSKKEGQVFKGPVADAITGCPGTEQRIVFLAAEGGQIELVEYKPRGKALVGNKASDVGSAHVCFRTKNIQELYQKLLKNSVHIHCMPQDLGFVRAMYFRDPDGIILEALEGEPPT
jgi:catechol 2,3-dioxygenase-like lactoylglutathione lyase family enzyme